ncbi:zinc-ribbon domain-containing protein [bacterium]|nr:zinc-ribbon domain-containing protein [bacterium]
MRVCPFCGEMISDKAKACPYCGSDELTGWQQTFESDDGFDFEPEDHEKQSDAWLNFKKHPAASVFFFLLVLIVIALFLYLYVF